MTTAKATASALRLSPERIAKIRSVLDDAATEMNECCHRDAKLEYIHINAYYQPSEDRIFDKWVMDLPDLVELLDRADEWTNGMAAKDAEIARLRHIIARSKTALHKIWPDGTACSHANARAAFAALEEAKEGVEVMP